MVVTRLVTRSAFSENNIKYFCLLRPSLKSGPGLFFAKEVPSFSG